ncbi:MAG: hypothetical protein VKK04_20070 [Synechococcales bacterium]|nr:hypothetical protein [Synechococcales bacterium]
MTNPTEHVTPASHPDDPSSEKVEISVRLDPDLLRQVGYLTDDPSRVIEVAVRQWLRGGARRDDDLTRSLERNPPVPTRGEWND